MGEFRILKINSQHFVLLTILAGHKLHLPRLRVAMADAKLVKPHNNVFDRVYTSPCVVLDTQCFHMLDLLHN